MTWQVQRIDALPVQAAELGWPAKVGSARPVKQQDRRTVRQLFPVSKVI
jgi:hypothetical protein